MNIKKLSELFELCLKISTTTKHDIFFQYSPHVEWVEVRYHFNGWSNDVDGIFIPQININAKDRDIDRVMDVLKEELL